MRLSDYLILNTYSIGVTESVYADNYNTDR